MNIYSAPHIRFCWVGWRRGFSEGKKITRTESIPKIS